MKLVIVGDTPKEEKKEEIVYLRLVKDIDGDVKVLSSSDPNDWDRQSPLVKSEVLFFQKSGNKRFPSNGRFKER
jgi:hypothetical protein